MDSKAICHSLKLNKSYEEFNSLLKISFKKQTEPKFGIKVINPLFVLGDGIIISIISISRL